MADRAGGYDDDPGAGGSWGPRPDQRGWDDADWAGRSGRAQADDWGSSGRGRSGNGGYGSARGNYGSARGSYGSAGGSRSGRGAGPGRGRSASRRTTAKSGWGTSAWAHWRRQSRLAKAGYVLATIAAAIVVVGGIGAFAVWEKLDGNITKVDVGGLTGRTIYGTQNILVLGSQERAGQIDRKYFGSEADPNTSNSDNLLLVHLNSTHTRATVLSIPRDLFVYEPRCHERRVIGNGYWPAQTYPPGAIIDGALNIGGPTCAVKTVEDLTGVELDHFVEFNFNSFREMVNSLGGVEVCVPKPGYSDPDSHLHLSPGKHLLKWNEALAYVRTRHGIGSGTEEGTDLARIQLQQAFISSVAQKVERQGILTDPLRLLSIADTATKNLTVDSKLGSVSEMLSLAKSLVHLHSRDISLITIPTTADTAPGESEHLMAVQPQDDVLYNMVRTGQTWHGQLPVEPYSKVQVRVLNATGQTGLAAKTARSLRKLGFDVTGVGDAPYTATTTVNYAGLAQADGAYTLMTALSSFPAGNNTLNEPNWQVGHDGPVTLVLGADFAGVNKPALGTHRGKKSKSGSSSATPAVSKSVTSGPGAVESRNGGQNICSGLPPAYNPNGA
jgi:LCP family protein required for cell wall assembly